MQLVRNVDDAIAALKDEKELAFDLETSGLSPWRDKIGIITLYGDRSDTAAVLQVFGKLPRKLIEFLERPGILIVGHNIMNFDLPYLYTHGVNIFNGQRYFDTLTASMVATVNGRKHTKQSLGVVLERELGIVIDKEISHGGWLNQELTDRQLEYAVNDIVHIHALMRRLIQKCKENGQFDALKLEMQILPAVLRMIVNGMPVDKERYDAYVAKQRVNEEKFRAKLLEIFGDEKINLGSTAQLKKALEAHGIRVASTARNVLKDMIYGEDFDDEVLDLDKAVRVDLDVSKMDQEEKKFYIIKLILAYRLAKQRLNMYAGDPEKGKLSWYDEHVTNGRAHSNFWPVKTDTGRWASSNPNLQQIPGDMRDVFGWVPGHQLLSVDYNQIEVWVMAILCGDENMLDFLETGDMHSRLAKISFKLPEHLSLKEIKAKYPMERKKAKAMTFALLFGGGANRLYNYLRSEGVHTTEDESLQLYLEFSRLFPKFHAYRNRCKELCNRRNAIPVRMPSGLMRLLTGDSLKYTTLMNTSVQGSAAAGLKNAIAMMVREGLDKYFVAAVHDELVLCVPDEEVPTIAPKIEEFMVRGMKEMLARMEPKALNVGIKAVAALGPSWKKE